MEKRLYLGYVIDDGTIVYDYERSSDVPKNFNEEAHQDAIEEIFKKYAPESNIYFVDQQRIGTTNRIHSTLDESIVFEIAQEIECLDLSDEKFYFSDEELVEKFKKWVKENIPKADRSDASNAWKNFLSESNFESDIDYPIFNEDYWAL